ncbi:MAG: hypothetical protein NTW87_09495 [Planctomycetota bacterium]|nr:hypothetical protein [Planctomycetota bacterium]
MAESQGTAVKIIHIPVQDVAHTMKAARLLYSAPSYVLRGPIYLIFVISFSALIYSFYGEVADLVTCPNLELKAEITKIQAPKSGQVAQIYVTEDQVINPLADLVDIQLKTGAAESEVDTFQEQLAKLNERKRLAGQDRDLKQREVTDLQDQIRNTGDDKRAMEADVVKEDQAFNDDFRKLQASVDILQIDLTNALKDVDRLQKSLVTRKEEEKRVASELAKDEELFKKQQITEPQLQASRTRYGQAREAVMSTETSLSQANEKVNQIRLKISDAQQEPARRRLEQERKKGDRDSRRARLDEKTAGLTSRIEQLKLSMSQSMEQIDAEIKRVQDEEAKVKALMPNVKLEGQRARVSSLYGGKVTHVYVKPDDAITRGTPMFGIWKETERIYAEIYIRNEFIGRVKKGLERYGSLEVQIKYGAYPYQEYGIKHGRITTIAEKPSSDVKGHETDYRAVVELQDCKELGAFSWVQGRDIDKPVPLTLGLVGMGEIKTGQRKLIELIFTPISKWFQNE